jgi:CDP-glycerol glycerophosphotransferase
MSETLKARINPIRKILFNRKPKSYTAGLLPYRNKNWQEALQLFELATTEQPDHADSHFKLGMCHFRQKNYEQAKKAITRAMLLSPERDEWKKQLAQTERHLSKKESKRTLAEREEIIRNQLEEDEHNAELYDQLAQVLRKQGKWWQEVEALKKATELVQNNGNWFYRLGEALEVMNRFQQAAQSYGKAIKIKGGNADAQWFYRQGYCYARTGHDGVANLKAAKRAYAEAVSRDKKLNAKRFGIGVFHQARGLWPQAQQAYLEQLTFTPLDAELNFRLGMAYDRSYLWKKAEIYYRKSLAFDFQQPHRHFRLGFILERQEKFTEAAQAYHFAATQSTKHNSYWFYRWAYVLEQQGKHYAAAQSYLKTALKPELESMRASTDRAIYFDSKEANFQSHALTEYTGNFDKSFFIISTLSETLEKDKTNPEVWYQLGNAYESQGSWTEAAIAYKNAIERKSEYNPEWYYRLGFSLEKTSNYKDACIAFRNTRIIQKAYGVDETQFDNNNEFRETSTYNEYYESLPISDNTIFYESFHGVSISCNPYALYLRMSERKDFKKFKHIWVINDKEKIPDELKSREDTIFIKRNSDAYMRYLASASILINNTSFPSYFIRKPNQKYLNTWHGTPWKTLGKDIKDGVLGFGNIQRNFLQATHLISPNQHTSHVMTKKYDIDEILPGTLLETGYPRIDLTLNATEQKKQKLRKTLNVDNKRKTILYAPTWRSDGKNPSSEVERISKEISALKRLDANILFRGHYFVESAIYENELANIVVPEEVNSNELLSIVDILITDYSSILFDHLVTDNPIILHLPDYEEYKETRGLYFESNFLDSPVTRNIDELIGCANKLISNSTTRNHYNPQSFILNEDGFSSDRVLNFILTENSGVNIQNKKKNIVFYGGTLIPNGITISLLNLLNTINHEKINAILIIEPNIIKAHPERMEMLERVNSKVKIIPKCGRLNRSIEEHWLEQKMAQYKSLPSKEMVDYLAPLYQKEIKRLLGEVKIDHLVNFDGYTRFWAILFAHSSKEIKKSIYLHSDMQNEHIDRFPNLEYIFNLYKHYNNLISVSKSTNTENKNKIPFEENSPPPKMIYIENTIIHSEIKRKSLEDIPKNEAHIFKNCDCIFISIGRLSIEKGHESLIRSFKLLLENNKQKKLKLIIIGDGPLKQDLNKLIFDQEIENHVHLLGRKANPFSYLKASNCFVFSSKHEGQGLSILEALSLNKPVICTDFPCAHDVLEDGDLGLIVENSINGLYEGMQKYITGKLNYKEFNPEEYQKRALSSFYKEICEL